jgi:hypothetical protein
MINRQAIAVLLGLLESLHLVRLSFGFSVTPNSAFTPPPTSSLSPTTSAESEEQGHHAYGNVLLLDHVNLNHEQGRHDWLTSFYVDFLGCALDPRKAENVAMGRKTVWVNIGAHQFHLPEGSPQAQVLSGVLTLVYPDSSVLCDRVPSAHVALQTSCFSVTTQVSTSKKDGSDSAHDSAPVLHVTDPWGTRFDLVQAHPHERDTRGQQPGDASLGIALRDVTLWVPPSTCLEGIGRFYTRVLGAPVLSQTDESVCISMGPLQTLTYQRNEQVTSVNVHVDLHPNSQEDLPITAFPSNYGPHVSLYVADLIQAYRRAEACGVAYVNPRFKRRAYTCEEAQKDCMFRCLDIVDPDHPEKGVLLRVEHEVRSVVTTDGTK